jgi:hypothetical protein
MISDKLVHLPPMTGAYHYNNFVPGSGGFPAIGGTYVDPVFNETIRRVTNYGAGAGFDNMYAHHWVNADGTWFFDDHGSQQVRDVTTGAVLYSGFPVGLASNEKQWHPTDPHKYFYLTATGVHEYDLTTDNNVTFATGVGTIQVNGGSQNWCDGTADFFVLIIGGVGRLYQRSIDTLYTGSALFNGGSYVTLSPDANFVLSPGSIQRSYAVDKGAHSLGSAVQFWKQGSDHGSPVTASDGKSYWLHLGGDEGCPECTALGFDSNNNMGMFAIDVSTDEGTVTQQMDAARLLYCINWGEGLHTSGGVIGANKDWGFLNTESNSAGFGNPLDVYDYDPASGWVAFEQEIIAVNVLTGELKRLAHHRSRSINAYYDAQPHITCSWDGSVVMWGSNFNFNSLNYTNRYLIQNPLGEQVSDPSRVLSPAMWVS